MACFICQSVNFKNKFLKIHSSTSYGNIFVNDCGARGTRSFLQHRDIVRSKNFTSKIFSVSMLDSYDYGAYVSQNCLK